MNWFSLYLRWYVGRHFHGVRLTNGQRFPRAVEGPSIIYLNHPSWWDPLTGILIARHFLPYADHYAPIDEMALQRYKFFGRLGLFPIEMNTARGARQFLRTAIRIVSAPNSVLWLTPEGRFTDPRTRPLVFKEGLAALLGRVPHATVLPVAIEYVFWDERLPEILINCGDPLSCRTQIVEDHGLVREYWANALPAALSATQLELAALAMTRDRGCFEDLLEGRAGVAAMYDLWRRMRAGATGERYQPEHRSIHYP